MTKFVAAYKQIEQKKEGKLSIKFNIYLLHKVPLWINKQGSLGRGQRLQN